MTLFGRFRKWLNRITSPNQSYGQRTIFVPSKNAGVYVDHDTALNFSAVYAAVAYRSETIASLPWQVFRRLSSGGNERAITHGVDSLLNTRPNPYMTPFALKCFLLSMAQLWGNAFLEIEKDMGNRPRYLWPITSDRVDIKFDANGRLYYEVSNAVGEKSLLDSSQVYHLAGMGFDGIKGHSVVSLAQRSIGQGIAADQFMSSFFANGTVLSGMFSYPEEMSQESYDRLKEDIKAKYSGATKAWEPLLGEGGLSWQTMGMPLQDAQFLENRKFTVEDIARWFRVPPHKIGSLDKATFSNIEHQSIESVQESILPWVVRMEQEADYKLISLRNQNMFFTKINMRGLMRGDAKSRADYYNIMRNAGVINVNEIRQLEDLNPIGPDGDKYVMQSQFTTLEKIGEEKEIPPQLQFPALEEEEENTREAHRQLFKDAAIRVLRREEKRALQAAGKYKSRGLFIEWLDSFYGQQIIYAAESLKIPLQALSKIVLNGNQDQVAGELDTALTMFLYKHVKESRLAILSYYDDGEELWNEEERATTMADHLMNQVFNFSLLKGVLNENG